MTRRVSCVKLHQLLRQRDLTQQKIEGMILRLKAMEQA